MTAQPEVSRLGTSTKDVLDAILATLARHGCARQGTVGKFAVFEDARPQSAASEPSPGRAPAR
jgi:hypothetical protein